MRDSGSIFTTPDARPHAASSQLGVGVCCLKRVGRVTPCAPSFFDAERRAGDCPPYQFCLVTGRRSYNPELFKVQNDFAAAFALRGVCDCGFDFA
jgi:hypothetical protein